jgi:hypothetical protein
MSVVGDLVQGMVESALREILRKAAGTGRRARRRTRSTTRTLTAAERLRRIEQMLKPAKRQVSRRRTMRSRSKAHRRRY